MLATHMQISPNITLPPPARFIPVSSSTVLQTFIVNSDTQTYAPDTKVDTGEGVFLARGCKIMLSRSKFTIPVARTENHVSGKWQAKKI